jgi:hypothetical protein
LNAVAISLTAFAIMLAGAFGATYLRRVLPERHFSDNTKDVVRLGTGLIGTIAALVLGLLIASANSSYQGQSDHIEHIAADLILIDQLLAQYGPGAQPVRQGIRDAVDQMVNQIWRENEPAGGSQFSFHGTKSGESTSVAIAQLEPQNDLQRLIKDRAVQAMIDLGQTRLQLFEQSSSAIPLPFLLVLIFWLAIIFSNLGLFSDLNALIVCAIVIFAVSAAGALFLVLELGSPFTGLMRISDAPLRHALAPL